MRISFTEVNVVARTLKGFLQKALMPLGGTMYVYGGGWNEADDGAGDECRRIGIDPRWRRFFEQQNAAYDHREHRYRLGAGLDCSGYVGWTLYNTLEREKGNAGYVEQARDMARELACRGWGTLTKKDLVREHRAGDIMSGDEHAWIALGDCDDGSVLLLHSSPPGVSLCGTVSLNGEIKSTAAHLAEHYVSAYYPYWYEKFPPRVLDDSYLRDYDCFRWDPGKDILTDPDGYAIMTPEEILNDLFSERSF